MTEFRFDYNCEGVDFLHAIMRILVTTSKHFENTGTAGVMSILQSARAERQFSNAIQSFVATSPCKVEVRFMERRVEFDYEKAGSGVLSEAVVVKTYVKAEGGEEELVEWRLNVLSPKFVHPMIGIREFERIGEFQSTVLTDALCKVEVATIAASLKIASEAVIKLVCDSLQPSKLAKVEERRSKLCAITQGDIRKAQAKVLEAIHQSL